MTKLVRIPLLHQDIRKEPKGSGAVIMTGQEWYERFIAELDKTPMPMSGKVFETEVAKAARKAAGLPIQEEKPTS